MTTETAATPTRTVKLKTAHNCEGVFLAHPNATPGPQASATVYAITDVPTGTTDAEVIRLYSGTVNATWLFTPTRDLDSGRFTFRFDEIGIGRMIKH
jgi:hypothetical protein